MISLKKNEVFFNITIILIFALLITSLVFAFPTIDEILNPTGTTSNLSIIIKYNFSQDDLLNPSSIKFNWNNINNTIYDYSLVLWFPLNNFSSLGENSTFIADNSKYNNNGRVVGSGVVFNPNGVIEGAYNFTQDGGCSYVYIPSSQSLNLTGINTYTISLWAQRRDLGADREIIVQRNGESKFLIRADSLSRVFFTDYTSGTGITTATPSGKFTNDGKMHHIVVSRNVTSLRVYFDGVLNASQTSTAGTINSTNNTIYLGQTTGCGPGFNGTIDELMMWNRSLSPTEISQLYNSQLVKYDTQNWTYTINQTLSHGANNYYLCSSNSTGGEICSAEKTITQDTCTYLGSGNWNINCSDNCIWNDNQNILYNITLSGTGIVNLNSNFSFTGSNQFIFQNQGCEFRTNNGGGFNT